MKPSRPSLAFASVMRLRAPFVNGVEAALYPRRVIPVTIPCPTKGAAIQSHNNEDQSILQRGTPGVRQKRYGEAELP